MSKVKKRWPGPRIVFNFLECPSCKQRIRASHCKLLVDELREAEKIESDVAVAKICASVILIIAFLEFLGRLLVLGSRRGGHARKNTISVLGTLHTYCGDSD